MIYYTSDLHFGQKSLLATGKWKERPFETLEEMHAAQIKRWNDKVTRMPSPALFIAALKTVQTASIESFVVSNTRKCT